MRISDWSSDVCSSDLGIGSVLLGYLSDRLADSNFAGDYAAICLAAKPGQAPAACAEAAAIGLQHAMMAVGGFLLLAIINYIFAARSLPWEMRGVEGRRQRSKERGGGKECVSTCRSRWG